MASTKKRYIALVVLNILAVLVTSYLTFLHFKPDASSICNFSAKWDCEIVNKSIYSTFFGMPVSVLGLLSYLALVAFSIRGLKHEQRRLLTFVIGCTLGAVGFSFYLSSIEFFVLQTFCIFCVTQQLIILLDLGIFSSLYLTHRKTS